MTAAQRRETILALINDSADSIKTSELAAHLNVTTETIRKDLIYLDNRKLIKKFHGGAKPAAEFVERALGLRLSESVVAKRAIAQQAIEQIAGSSVIFIDAGSTTSEFAKLLLERAQLSEAPGKYAIITNSFTVANILNNSAHTLFFIGGEVSSVTQSTSGLWALNALQSVKIDVAFLGSSGFFSHNGPCTKIGADALFKSEVIKNSGRKIVLADHRKFATKAIMQYADWSEIDLLITDAAAPPEELESLQEQVDIICSPVNGER